MILAALKNVELVLLAQPILNISTPIDALLRCYTKGNK